MEIQLLESPKPIFITITGPSGSGKSTLSKALSETGTCSVLISHTTRDMRKGEAEGKDYYFVTEREFKSKVDNDEFLEHVEFSGNKYGVSKEEVESILALNRIPVLVVEPNGLHHVSEYCESEGIHHVSVYLDGNLADLIGRLLTRDLLGKTITTDLIEYAKRRISSLVLSEMGWYNEFSYTNYLDHYNSENQSEVMNSVLTDISIIRKDWQRPHHG